jgi:hypothetical protein
MVPSASGSFYNTPVRARTDNIDASHRSDVTLSGAQSHMGFPVRKDDLIDMSLKLFSAGRSTFAIDSSQQKELLGKPGAGGKSGGELTAPVGIVVRLVVQSKDVFGDMVDNRTHLDCIATRLEAYLVEPVAGSGKDNRSNMRVAFSRERGPRGEECIMA